MIDDEKLGEAPNPEKVVGILGDRGAVEVLEELLEQARSGGLKGVVVVGATSDNGIVRCGGGYMDPLMMAGGLDLMKFEMLGRYLDA